VGVGELRTGDGVLREEQAVTKVYSTMRRPWFCPALA
jgi:hypothetical protein